MSFAGAASGIDSEAAKCHNLKRENGMRSKLNNPEEDTIGPKDAAILLGISASTLWRLTNEGIVPVAGYLRMRSAKPTEEPKFRAVYSRQDLLALKDEWNRMGLSKGKHIKRRYDSGGERPPE